MKLLIIGIDGGDRCIIEAMPMPFLRKLLSEAWHKPAQEDLFARGWAKILSGKGGAQTGAFYAKPDPVPNGCGATTSWKSTDYQRVGAVPLWDSLNDEGLSVGFMNLPTTYPAPAVNGFFVAGAGGGIGDGAMPPGSVHPNSVADMLRQHDYIFDTRFKVSGIRDYTSLLQHLRTMTERRVSAYAALQDKHRVDVGFVAFMGPKVLQYLAMKDIERAVKCSNRNGQYPKDLTDVTAFYAHFDEQLRLLIEAVKPQRIMVVSDHGQVPHRFDVDVDAFLAKHGWLQYRHKALATFQTRLRRAIKSALPTAFGKKLSKKPALRKFSGAQSNIDFSKSVAFGLRNVPGIYTNDERFGGAVGSEQRESLIDRIVKAINGSGEAVQHNIRARQYRGVVSAHPDVEPLLPDIWLDLPEGYLVDYGVGNSTGKLDSLVADNPAYLAPLDVATATRDQWTGMKGRSALLAVWGHCSAPAPETDDGDLTVAYRLVRTLAMTA